MPTFLGGTDETPFPSDKGPWQDYECVDNIFRKKGEKTEGQEEVKVAGGDDAQEAKPVVTDNQEEKKEAAPAEEAKVVEE